MAAFLAQRRPGRESRRHLPRYLWSVNTCALNEGRDVNPGDTHEAARAARRAGSLNEGRDVNPGDTAHANRLTRPRRVRSTKAGT